MIDSYLEALESVLKEVEVSESYWGKGIMSEVVSAVIKEMRESGEIEELVIYKR